MNTNSDVNLVTPLMQAPVPTGALAVGKDSQKRQNNKKRQGKPQDVLPSENENTIDEQQSDGLDFRA